MEDNEAAIASPRKYSGAGLRYREERRIKQREERNARKVAASQAEKAAYLAMLRERFFVSEYRS